MNRIEVAIAIVVRDGRVLVARRHDHDALAGYWEFPGGKVERGESPAECAVREVREETAIEARATRALTPIDWDYDHVRVRLLPFLCQWAAGEAKPLGCAELRWAAPAELRSYRFPPANDSLLDELAAIL